MFGLFKKKKSISEYAQEAEILPVAENGDYKAFLIRVQDTSSNLSSVIKIEGGTNAIAKFVQVIDQRILKKDFEDIFALPDQMHRDYGTVPPKRNPNVERVVICSDGNGYVYKWTP
jgi:hypothetical protein